MNKDNSIIFKVTEKGISIIFSDEISFEEIKEVFIKKVNASSSFFNGVTKNIILKGRNFSEKEEIEILNIISEKTNMNITFLISEDKETGVVLSENIADCSFTKYHKGSIRSGQVLDFDGSLIIIGDVNPGAFVKATGNITVLGQLKGIAHAGYNGNYEAFVSAAHMIPVQLRIADKITVFPKENIENEKVAEFAYIENGQIYVRPLY